MTLPQPNQPPHHLAPYHLHQRRPGGALLGVSLAVRRATLSASLGLPIGLEASACFYALDQQSP